VFLELRFLSGQEVLGVQLMKKRGGEGSPDTHHPCFFSFSYFTCAALTRVFNRKSSINNYC
jgi:hypothetical protein